MSGLETEEDKSKDTKLTICRICIEILQCDKAEELNPAKVEMFKLLNVDLEMTRINESFLCFSCFMILKDNVEFKMGCLRNIVYCTMLPYEENNEESEESKIQLCILCWQPWKIGQLMLIDNNQYPNLDKDAIINCISEVDILSSETLLICPNCMEHLNSLSNFLLKCFKANQLIKNYIAGSNTDPLCLNMFDVFEYKINLKTEPEEEINLDIVKVEPQELNNNVVVKEEFDNLTIEECDLTAIKQEHYVADKNAHFYVEIDTIQKKNKQEYNCYHCRFKTDVKATLILHLLVHQNENVVQFKCDSCSFVSKWRTSLRTHKLLHKSENDVRFYYCKKCSYRSIYRKHLRRHMEKHSTKKYYCNECPFKTKSLGPFKTHNRHLHNKKVDIMYSDFEDDEIKLNKEKSKKNYKCSYCPYESHKSSRIKEHGNKHLGDDEVKWYNCNYCTFKSKYKASVNHHQKLHKQRTVIRKKNVRKIENIFKNEMKLE